MKTLNKWKGKSNISTESPRSKGTGVPCQLLVEDVSPLACLGFLAHGQIADGPGRQLADRMMYMLVAFGNNWGTQSCGAAGAS